jgi:hypothetical protein
MRSNDAIQKMGKRWGPSKLRYKWAFAIGDVCHEITFIDSKQSKKTRIFLNDRQIYEATRQPNEDFAFTVEIQGCKVCILKGASDSACKLTINAQPFKELQLSKLGSAMFSEDFTVMRSKDSFLVLSSKSTPMQTNDVPLISEDNRYSVSLPFNINKTELATFANEYIKVYDVDDVNEDPYFVSVVNTYNWKNGFKAANN